MTALDLVSRRPNAGGDGPGVFEVDHGVQLEIIKLLRNNGGKSSLPEPSSPHASPSSTGGYLAGFPDTPRSPHSVSPLGSPYDPSLNSSPRTLPDEYAGGYYSGGRAPGSVESYIQSSPESDHGADPTAGGRGRNYSFVPGMMGGGHGSPAHSQV